MGDGYQVLHQRAQRVGAGGGAAQKLAAHLGRHCGVVQLGIFLVEDGVHEALGGEERRFQLVRHVGQKLAAQGLQAL